MLRGGFRIPSEELKQWMQLVRIYGKYGFRIPSEELKLSQKAKDYAIAERF
mgnify:CR=1 FL=1